MASRNSERNTGDGNGGNDATATLHAKRKAPPVQTVLVLQGGGALGAYQVGVYQALHEAGIEPDWVIGTSIGAINAALISGNGPRTGSTGSTRSGTWCSCVRRWPRLFDWLGLGNPLVNMKTVARGIPASSRRTWRRAWGPQAGRRRAAPRTTAPSRCATRCASSSTSTTCARPRRG